MNPAMLSTLLALGLVVSALLGPRLLREAEPALARVPRLALGLLQAVVLVWIVALLALGPLTAWAIAGPVWLPEGWAVICQRCVAAANPFTNGTVDVGVPRVLLLVLPLVAAVLLAVGVGAELRQRRRVARVTGALLLQGAVRARVLGHDVNVVPDARPFALALPRDHGGIVVSTGALEQLDTDELIAVLEHESAHLSQRHHRAQDVVVSLCRYTRWVPLLRAVEKAFPAYLEIAADDRARARTGTLPLVGALLKFGDATLPVPGRPGTAALHAAGPERVRALVNPATGASGRVPALVVGGYLLLLLGGSAVVHIPYLAAALGRCM